MSELRIMEIERFAIHDGPGIRTVVFLQGCPLHCPWCANPESQIIKKQLMYTESKCTKCKTCLAHCPQNAITLINDKLVFNREFCGECEICGDVCPHNAIRFSGRLKSVEEILKEVLKDEDYYKASKGGLTLSGGEPFIQYEGFLELIKESKKKGLHIAIETTGNVDLEKVMEAEPYIDLFLLDIKHINPQKLLEVTGADFDKIVTNLKYIARKDFTKIIIRVPVIPTFNYDDQTIEGIFDLALKYNVLEVHLLPYHTLGKNKYDQLDKKYEFQVDQMLNKDELMKYVDSGSKKGVKVLIGG